MKKNNSLKLKLKKIKFAPLSNLNQLKKLIIYRALLSSQKRFDNKIIFAQLHEAINKLHETIAGNPEEHAMKLQESYKALKIKPWVGGEFKEGFQSRLTDSTIDTRINAKTIADVDSVKTSDLVDIDDAYKYLRNHATPLLNIPARGNRDEEDEIERYMKSNFSPSPRCGL